MTANSTFYQYALDFYNIFKMLGWNDRGTALGADKINEARKLGEDIK